jgi:phenylacetate-CoA ligase
MPSLVNRVTQWKALYRASPVWLQHLEVTAAGLLWRHHRHGGRFREFVQDHVTRERFDADEWTAYQTVQLRRLLAHACATVPFYRHSLGLAGLTAGDCAELRIEHLAGLPRLAKDELRQSPRGLISEAADLRRLHGVRTSGTTGTPIRVHIDREAHRAWFAANDARWHSWAGLDRRMSRAMIGGRSIVPRAAARPPFCRYNWAERQIYFSAFHIAPATIASYVRALNRFQPDYLVGYASSHFFLARMIREQGLQVHQPRAVLTTSETLTSEMRSTLMAVYGCDVFDAYGSVECCVLATECEHHRLHLSPDVGIVELLDQDGRPVEPGQAGEIVATGLLNFAQPLIRYRTGDWAVRSAEACPCGRSMPVIREIVGRVEDLVLGQDGREVVRLHSIWNAVPRIREGQIIQEEVSRFRVRVVLDGDLTDEERRRIQGRFDDRVGPVTIEFERVPHIERTENGKFRAVISRVTRAPRPPPT